MKTKIKSLFHLKALLIIILVLLLSNLYAQNKSMVKPYKTIKIAVVKEGPSNRDQIIELIKPDLIHMLGDEYEVIFDESEVYNANWKFESIRTCLVNAIKNEKIDLILGIGRTVAQEALHKDIEITKPFVGATLLNGLIPYVPLKDGYEIDKENVSLILLPPTLDDDLNQFSTFGDFETIHVGIDEFDYHNIKDLGKFVEQLSDYYKIDIKAIPISPVFNEAVAEIDSSVQAFYLIDLPRYSGSERRKLISYLNGRNILTFSNQGPIDLELGALATNKPDIRKEVQRRLALNIFHLIEGASTGDLNTVLQIDPKFIINAKTGLDVGYNPSFYHKVQAQFINYEYYEKSAPTLTIPELLKKVDENNASLAISRYSAEAVGKEESIARSFLFPQVGVGAAYENTHNLDLNGTIPDEQTVLGISVSQMIYDDEIVSGLRATNRIAEAANYQRDAEILDLFYEAEQVYYAFSQANLILKISMDNLRLTESNLELAKNRVSVGQSGKDEVYRWQVQLANQRADVLNAEAYLQLQRIALNQLLGVDQNLDWNPEYIIVDENYLSSEYKLLPFIFDSPVLFEKFRDVAVEFAKEKSPEINFFKQNLEAQDIIVGQQKRSFFLPKFTANFEYGHIFSQSAASFTLPTDNNRISVSAFLPIFEGTRKIHSTQKEEIIYNELTERLELANQLVEKRTRTSLRLLESSYPNLRFSRDAAENARKNLSVVRDKYANGIVNITELLDAQNTSFTADQNEAIANYTFLSDLVELERASGIIYHALTQEEQNELEEVIKNKMNISN